MMLTRMHVTAARQADFVSVEFENAHNHIHIVL